MAIESARGCGYRKVGGTYMVSGELTGSCDRLPFKLDVCPCCGEGYRPSRNIRQIWPEKMLGGVHSPCSCSANCYICNPIHPVVDEDSGHYLEWIGEGFYKTADDFSNEALSLGISRRLKSGIPRDLVVGKSIIYVAHRKVTFTNTVKSNSGRKRGFLVQEPGIFAAFIVRRLEHICTESELSEVVNYQHCNEEEVSDYEWSARTKQLVNMISKGVDLIAVPDNDPDHR